MKKVLKIIGGIIIITVIIILSISYIIINNQEELEKLKDTISKNYNPNETITYSNEYGNYYIIKTQTKVVVLTKDFKEVVKEDLSKLSESPNNSELIYRTNKLMYEETIRKKEKIIYNYYDATSGKKIKTTTLEQQ